MSSATIVLVLTDQAEAAALAEAFARRGPDTIGCEVTFRASADDVYREDWPSVRSVRVVILNGEPVTPPPGGAT